MDPSHLSLSSPVLCIQLVAIFHWTVNTGHPPILTSLRFYKEELVGWLVAKTRPIYTPQKNIWFNISTRQFPPIHVCLLSISSTPDLTHPHATNQPNPAYLFTDQLYLTFISPFLYHILFFLPPAVRLSPHSFFGGGIQTCFILYHYQYWSPFLHLTVL